jgi:serine/threonine-protein kinase RsbW
MTKAMSAPETVGSVGVNRVELSLAADAQMLFLARMTAAAVASRADFDLEQVEDLRLAIDELCVRLMNAGAGAARISLVFQWDASELDVLGTLVPEGGPTRNGHHASAVDSGISYELSERILDALVDGHGDDIVGGVHRAWLQMKRVGHLA